jgi:hypothetical protein
MIGSQPVKRGAKIQKLHVAFLGGTAHHSGGVMSILVSYLMSAFPALRSGQASPRG